MKKIIEKILCFSLFVLFGFHVQAQFMTLQGKQFKDENGNDFYPKVCNYIVDLAYDGTNYFFMPHTKYGATWVEDCNDLASCQQRIKEDFDEMKLMGFNSVRIMGAEVRKEEYRFPSVGAPHIFKDHYVITYENFPNTGGSGEAFDFLEISPPYDVTLNPNLQILFSQINSIINFAQAAGLKVILITGGGKYFINNDIVPINSSSGNIDQQHANDYADYLLAHSDYFKNNNTILAYDLYNEPRWSMDGLFTKQNICAWTHLWYDVIKNKAPNRLVTMGNHSLASVINWDNNIMKLDFLSLHIYHSFTQIDNFNIQSAIERWHDELVWFKNNVPLPWIIGETGFVGSNNSDPSYQFFPFIWGNEADQSDFLEWSLNEVRNAGGSGYSWWQFQDVHWFSPADGGIYKENWFGLLRYANPIGGLYISANRKPAVLKLQNYNENIIGTFSGPSANYYNPFNHPTNPVDFASIPSVVAGKVVDQYSQPIKDAVIFGYTLLYINSLGKEIFDYHYTFTNSTGNYAIFPYDFDPRSPNYNKWMIYK